MGLSRRPVERLTPEQQELVLKWIPLVQWVVNQKASTRAVKELGRDESFQYGCLGLIRAAQKYDPNRGVAFNTYSVPWIWAAIQDHAPMARTVKHPHRCYRRVRGKIIHDMITTHQQSDTDFDLIYQKSVPSHEDSVDGIIDLPTYLSILGDRSQKILIESVSTKSRRQIAREMGCTYQNVDRVVKESIEHIRNRFQLKSYQEGK